MSAKIGVRCLRFIMVFMNSEFSMAGAQAELSREAM